MFSHRSAPLKSSLFQNTFRGFHTYLNCNTSKQNAESSFARPLSQIYQIATLVTGHSEWATTSGCRSSISSPAISCSALLIALDNIKNHYPLNTVLLDNSSCKTSPAACNQLCRLDVGRSLSLRRGGSWSRLPKYCFAVFWSVLSMIFCPTLIPGGCTSLVQPSDISINKPLEAQIRDLTDEPIFDYDIIDNFRKRTVGGRRILTPWYSVYLSHLR